MREFGLQQRAAQFWRENLPSCVAFFFFFMLGAACGYAACRPLLGDALLDAARALLAGGSAPRLLAVAAVSLLHEGAWACAILFSGLQAWTVPLWMLCVALRGFAAGAAAALCALLMGRRLQPIEQMMRTIEDTYYYYDENVGSEDALIDAALRGMAAGIGDRYAQYFTAEEYASFLQSNSGENTGIGILISQTEEGCVIERVYEDSPIAATDAQAGDLVVSINGTALDGLTLDEAAALIRTDGTENTLVLRRGGETLTVSAAAAVYHVPYSAYEMLSGGVGYLRLIQFEGHVAEEAAEALESLKAQGAASLVLDLRGNPGGMLDQVLAVADLFLGEGELVASTRTRTETTRAYYTEDEDAFGLPVVVLVNGDSASASELLAGALKDHGAATVMGTQTYGKGIVQTFYRLPANGGYVKLTTDAYFTPSGVCVQDVGITPDVTVELPEAYRGVPLESLPREQDAQLAAAVAYLTEGA